MDGRSYDAARRQHLIVGFADLSGSTEIASKLEPEIYAGLIARLRKVFNQNIRRHGGEVIRVDGDGATFVFEHEGDYEDAGRRAVEAALDLHEAAAALDRELDLPDVNIRLHSGIHAGIVIMQRGNIEVGKYLILGEATSAAKRLSDLAAADQIIVSELTLGPEQHFFQCANKRVVSIRGSQQKLAILEIVGRSTVENRFVARLNQGVAKFSGRQKQLDELIAQYKNSVDDFGANVIIVGSPGLGKTRLLNEFRNVLSEMGVSSHRGYCEAYLGARPFQPISQIVRSVLITEHGLPNDADPEAIEKCVSKINPALVSAVLQLLSAGKAASQDKMPGFEVVLNVLASLLNTIRDDRVPVLMIDDWQWKDGGSGLVIENLQSSLDRPCFIVFATRELDHIVASMAKAKVLELEALSKDDAEKAIEGLLKSSGPFDLREIIEQSGGNPLFLEELCHAVASGRSSISTSDRRAWLEALVHARFGKLSAELADLVQIASVMGHMIPVWLYEKITGLSIGDDALTALEKADFVYSSEYSDTLKFKHIVTRDAVYSTVDLNKRKAIHNRIVQALHERAEETGEEELEALAYHYRAGGNRVRGVEYAILAGDRAMNASSLDRAQAHFQSALEQIDDLEDRDSLAEQRNALVHKFGRACVVDPSWDQLSVLKRAADIAAASGDSKAFGWAEYWVGFILYGLGEARKAISHLEKARLAAQTVGDEKQITAIHATLGQAHATACEYEPALKLLNEAIEYRRGRQFGANAALALSYSISCKAFIYADYGRFEKAYKLFDMAMEVLDNKEHEMTASVLTMRSASCLWQGRFSEAKKLAQATVQIAERSRARYLYAMSRVLIAAADWEVDKEQAHLDIVVESTNWLEAAASQQFISLNYGWLANGFVDLKDRKKVRHFAAKALVRARKGDRLGEAITYRALSRLAEQDGKLTRAQNYLVKAERSADIRKSGHERSKNQSLETKLELSRKLRKKQQGTGNNCFR